MRLSCSLLAAGVAAVVADDVDYDSYPILSDNHAETDVQLFDRTFTEMIPMRDGTELHTRFFVPRGTEIDSATKRPVAGSNLTIVMDRSPYGQGALELLADIYVPFGFASAGQDMRGTHLSEGNFTVWHTDADDAFDTMQWFSEQDWTSGEVMTIGGSADGLCSFVMLYDQPEWLKKQFIIWSSSVGYEIIFPGGAYRQSLADVWIRSTVPDQADTVLAEVKANEYPNDWWSAINGTSNYGKVDWPSVMWAGWYDIFLAGNLMGFEGYQKESAAEVQGQHRLVIDPLGHCQEGAKYFSPHLIAGRSAIALLMSLDLYGVYDFKRDLEAITMYVMGPDDSTDYGNYWTTLADWPAYTATDYFLHADGTLSLDAPDADADADASTSYVYDPADPTPSLGGNNLEIACGPLDQTPLEGRDDVLLFTSPAFDEATALTGRMTATLHVSSDAVDTDFMAKVTDVYPDGQSRLIQDSAVRMRWRDRAGHYGDDTPVAMKAGEVYEVEVDLWSTSYVFAPGHALRLAVSSSNAPRFSVNPNNGLMLDDPNKFDANVTATNTLHHSAEHPSRVTLPVVALGDLPEKRFIGDLMGDPLSALSEEEISALEKTGYVF